MTPPAPRSRRYLGEVSYGSIEDPAKLRRVFEATLLLEADLELPSLLRHVIDEARAMTGARYAALGILNDDRTALAEFITSGLAPDEEERIGARPTGRGVLGTLITDPRPLRLASLGSHPDSFGFPPSHPPMTSFLGVPIKARGEVYGNLYLTDKVGWSEFTSDDEALVVALALAAGIAVENTRLHRRVQEMAVYEDRERLARDLHDNVIQRLFAVGLSVQGLAGTAEAPVAERLDAAVSDIDDIIRQIRSSIYELGITRDDRGVRADVLAILRELGPVVGLDVRASFDGPVDSAIADHVAVELLATVREAVTNIGRHARATRVTMHLVVDDGWCRLEVVDDGRGIGASRQDRGGPGLVNLRRRAEKLHGRFSVESPPTGGTSLVWQVPISQ